MTPPRSDAKLTLTRDFRVPSGEYLLELLKVWFPRYGWSLIIPILLCAIIGIILADQRFSLVALMLVFIVCPMALSFIYTYYMLTPEVARATSPLRATVRWGESIHLEVLKIKDPDPVDPENPDAPSEEAPQAPSESITIPWSDIQTTRFTSSYYIFILPTPRLHLILIPYDAVE